MHHIDAKIRRFYGSNDRIKICAVHIEDAVHGMNEIGNFFDMSFKKSAGIRIRHHDACDFRRKNTFDFLDFDDTLATIMKAAKRFNADNVKADQVAKTGGAPIGDEG